jgi:hypothetical protein
MATTSPARIDDDLYASAKLAGEVQSRSAAQQVVHWARIGREIEASAGVSHQEIARVLAGSRSYDSLSAKEQAVVRAEWSARIDTYRDALNLADRFAATGRTWVELDDGGAIVERGTTTGGGGAVGVGHAVKKGSVSRVKAKKGAAVVTPDKAAGRGAGSLSSG